jgi:hypothetical protein
MSIVFVCIFLTDIKLLKTIYKHVKKADMVKKLKASFSR